MQLKITTDYAVRIVYYLALRKETVTAAQLSEALKIPESYIPKITKRLKDDRMTFRRNYFMVFCKPVY